MKKAFNYLLTFAILTLIILDYNSVWSNNINTNHTLQYIMGALAIICLIFSLKEIVKYFKRIAIYLIIYLSYLFIQYLIHPETYDLFFKTFGIKFLCIFIFIFYIQCKNNDSIICLVLYISITILHIIQTNNYISVNWGTGVYSTFHNIYYQYQYIYIRSFLFVRNQGIFLEPGAYSLYLVYALLVELFLRKKRIRFLL